jgi:hypothetical protein
VQTRTSPAASGKRKPTRRTSGRRFGSVLVAVALAVVVTAAPALAAGYKSGSQNCTGIGYIKVRSETSGLTKVFVPIGTLRNQFDNGAALIPKWTFTTVTSGTWAVDTTGTLLSSGTYSGCAGV